MLLLLFILTYDSLPPLPDLSKIDFPEPPLWVASQNQYLTLHGYGGDFYGGYFNLSIQRFNANVLYEKKHDWDTRTYGEITANYSIPLNRFWIQPSIYGFFLDRNFTYRLLNPSLDFSSTFPWAVVFGKFSYDQWYYSNDYHSEHEAQLSIIFDQTAYLPHIEISEVFTGGRIKPAITGKLHVRNFHIAAGTPIADGFVSPHLDIQYLDPKIKVETRFKSGLIYKRLRNFFDPTNPQHYRIPVPDESLKLGIDLNISFDFYNHIFGIYSTFRNWSVRLIPAENFEFVRLNDVQEANISAMVKNNIHYRLLHIANALHAHYNWSDTTIPFLPEHAFVDTMSVRFAFIDLSSDLYYQSGREGISQNLPEILIINSDVGLRIKFIKLFMKIYNITNEKNELYDGYFIADRQYAAGIEIHQTF
ncbi:hypothetical protein AMJ52_07755 [candidate division TA06 bacterium DG_78]|uniref:TonB-dependent receptor-like beta-barrel domain-containing protein n=1 Tax=candidate division TA06 bacterium DG_78 TaxID=1703772 RepID=A0A0S7YB26_UNCT6|nr:MAG: hypothetical protein AMJ52_07755 [candidate division TA06 bacterium DG_78]